ncbi:hypothetical protein KZZ52_32950 [Dactylosporangium sp. AC04546]|uniref:hypothetical protein n=1 Tax=Dactylosporangium sp. AC04546 TaxID=2862460 RepID=UPI001EE01A33|nr:hypothetical protein [Dactylosporangium sp. AC04546]WVK78800.1 hypothetical protein KZZ52_32950 [Dactylosporangium sp. AC04546]
MTSQQDKEYDLTDFDADNYRAETELAAAAAYYFPSLAEESAQAAQLSLAVGDLLQTAMICGGIDMMPFTIRDQNLVVVACRGYETVGISVIDPTGDVARDVVTWLEPTHAAWVERVLKIELLRNAREAGIERVIVRDGTATEAIYVALGLHPVEVTA